MICSEKTDAVPPHLHFPLERMAASTFFVNHRLQVEWIKAARGDRLARAIAAEWKENPSGTIFDTLLHASLKELFFNWQPLFSFVYQFLRQSTPKEIFDPLAPAFSVGKKEVEDSRPALSEFSKMGRIDSCSFALEDDSGNALTNRLFGLVLREGTVFVNNAQRDTNVDAARRQPSPKGPRAPKTPFGVLSARLDNASSIVDTLLPEAYYRLMQRIWNESDRLLTACGGHRSERSGSAVQYLIAGKPGLDPGFKAVQCAVTLRTRLREMAYSLQSAVGWNARIRLNIGISSGLDRLREEDPTASMAFLLPGGASDQAKRLAALGPGGAIWVTKSTLRHMDPALRKRILFGLYRKNRLIPHIFANITDLRQTGGVPPRERLMPACAVTRIVALKRA